MSNSPFQNKVRKVSRFARLMDAVLVVVFAGLAVKSSVDADWAWAVGFGVCAIFCAYTATTGPIDRVFEWARSRFIAAQHKSFLPDNQAGMSRQQRRREARTASRSRS